MLCRQSQYCSPKDLACVLEEKKVLENKKMDFFFSARKNGSCSSHSISAECQEGASKDGNSLFL